MAAPITVRAAGIFDATQGGAPAGEATVWMRTATQGSLELGGQEWKLTGNATTKKFRATLSGSVVQLKIVNRNTLSGDVDGTPLELTRAVLRPIPAAEMAQSDPGPTGTMKTFMDTVPDYETQ